MNDWARPVVHFEIRGRETQKLRSFYAQLFNWEIGEDGLMTIEPGIGGPEPGPGGHIARSEAPGVTLYVQVRDLAETLGKAKDLGGEVTFERFDIPGGASLAGIKDPEGNTVTLVQQ